MRSLGSDAVLDVLRERIICGDLSPGKRLLEPELAETLGVSRTPVREALRMLEAEGLAERRPTGGYVVSAMSIDDARELHAVRLALDVLATRDAIGHWHDSDTAQLQFILDQSERLIDHEAEIQRLGAAFHDYIRTRSGNRRCIRLLNDMEPQIHRYRLITTQSQSRRDASITEHREILRAIAAHDVRAAEAAVTGHVNASFGALCSIWPGSKAPLHV